MSLDDWHFIFVSVCLVLIVTASVPVITAYLPKREEPFFELAVLGENGKVELYFPNNDTNVQTGEDIHWNVYVYNHMGETKYVALRIKFLNSTMAAPNSTLCVPSQAPLLYEVQHILLNNETWLFPLNWTLTSVSQDREVVFIKSLDINGEVLSTNLEAIQGHNFRVVLELWVYDSVSDSFAFGWFSGQQLSCVWNEVWFNATSAK